MKKSINKEIIKIASMLPKVPMLTKNGVMLIQIQVKKIDGDELLKKDSNAKDGKGIPIQPSQTYISRYKVPVFVNHNVELHKAHKLDSINGINNYIKKILPTYKP